MDHVILDIKDLTQSWSVVSFIHPHRSNVLISDKLARRAASHCVNCNHYKKLDFFRRPQPSKTY